MDVCTYVRAKGRVRVRGGNVNRAIVSGPLVYVYTRCDTQGEGSWGPREEEALSLEGSPPSDPASLGSHGARASGD